MKKIKKYALWLLIALLGAIALGRIALNRGESINAVWIIAASISVYVISYRFYSRFVAYKVLGLNNQRLTPAQKYNDGMDYVPTNKWVLFGHHFAAIAGAGPLVGPILATQMGYLPSTLWILVGVVFAGAVQDMTVLFLSTRNKGHSLGRMIRQELGKIPGIIATIGILMIMVILLAVLALVVIKALSHSPWGTFTVAATIPIAFIMGLYSRYLRPGRNFEMSLIGLVLLLVSIVLGGEVAKSDTWAPLFTFEGTTLVWMLVIYGFVASVLPVWLLLTPRDYVSTFLKIGTIIGLAMGIVIVAPELKMPAVTQFVHGAGPVFSGNLFPFFFITIACGAISGFHALIASGTTPKMISKEFHIRPVAYGAMLMESFVAIMALIAATVLDPGIYFAMNSPASLIGNNVREVARTVSEWGFQINPDQLTKIAEEVGENSILSRAGGAPTLAVGMANILSGVIGGKTMMAFWYHFVILFEGLFILTTIDAGTRVLRFIIQDAFGSVIKPLGNTRSWWANILCTSLAVMSWGYFLYQGVVDPLGGINTFWPLFGIANQILAVMALILITATLIKKGKIRYLWVSCIPLVFLLIITLTASWQKIFSNDSSIGFLAHAKKFSDGIISDHCIKPAKNMLEMSQIIKNDRINASLAAFFILVVLTMLFFSARQVKKNLKNLVN